jgi:hypothetical protein
MLGSARITNSLRRQEDYFEVLKEYVNTLRIVGVTKMLENREFIESLIDYIIDSNKKQPDASFMSSPLDLLSLIIRGTVSRNSDEALAPTSLYQSEERNIILPNELR